MLQAAIDVGSNTLRMLIARVEGGAPAECRYYREITRLAGGFDPTNGLNPASVERTLRVLEEFGQTLRERQVEKIRAAGTAALRQAPDAAEFLAAAYARSGIRIEIIDGGCEAELSCRGIFSVLDPLPMRAVLFDIGGGSTELLVVSGRRVRYRVSLPLGVVGLSERFSAPVERQAEIEAQLNQMTGDPLWRQHFQPRANFELIGTAGTVTTLAAMKLELNRYDGARVNNLVLTRSWLQELTTRLDGMSLEERRQLPGLETGREEIIMPGLQLVDTLFALTGCSDLRVADAGLLEGLLLA